MEGARKKSPYCHLDALWLRKMITLMSATHIRCVDRYSHGKHIIPGGGVCGKFCNKKNTFSLGNGYFSLRFSFFAVGWYSSNEKANERRNNTHTKKWFYFFSLELRHRRKFRRCAECVISKILCVCEWDGFSIKGQDRFSDYIRIIIRRRKPKKNQNILSALASH